MQHFDLGYGQFMHTWLTDLLCWYLSVGWLAIKKSEAKMNRGSLAVKGSKRALALTKLCVVHNGGNFWWRLPQPVRSGASKNSSSTEKTSNHVTHMFVAGFKTASCSKVSSVIESCTFQHKLTLQVAVIATDTTISLFLVEAAISQQHHVTHLVPGNPQPDTGQYLIFGSAS